MSLHSTVRCRLLSGRPLALCAAALYTFNGTPGRVRRRRSFSATHRWPHAYDEDNPALLKRIKGPAHQVEYEYEPERNLITSAKNINAQNQSIISSYDYENNALGRRTSIAQRGSAFELLKLHGENSVQVAYNDRSEVTGYHVAKLGDENGAVAENPALSQSYHYDSIGNRTQLVSQSVSEKKAVRYQSNALNQYTQLEENDKPAEKPTHDPDGNLIDDAKNRYIWNAENRMVRVEAKDGSFIIDYTYDYHGRRTARKENSKTSERSTIFIYDGWNLLAEGEHEQERSASSLKAADSSLKAANSVRTYTWGRDLSGTLQGAGGVGGQLAISQKEQTFHDTVMFPCYDANGNINMARKEWEFVFD